MMKKFYTILPFRFARFPNEELLLVNEVGEFLFVKSGDFNKLINYELTPYDEIFLNLKGKHFIADANIENVVDMLAIKYRTKKAFLLNFTALHMIVVTARCNSRCKYCHASSEDVDKSRWDMTPSVAQKVVDMVFQSPSPIIKIEFQGGEPLLNWEVIKTIVEYAEALNKSKKKNLEFVLCTNLTLTTEEILDYLKIHNVLISTSLDGPQEIHNKHRVFRAGGGTYELFREKFNLSKTILGLERIAALMTTTRHSLPHFRNIINEYINFGFQGAFIRPLNPFGFAKIDRKELEYSVDDFIKAYKDALSYIIDINLKGTFFVEYYASLFLARILTPFSSGFMDLQFPAGVGISGVIYDYDGSVYPSDEARMMAKAGNKKFYLGNVTQDSYLNVFDGKLLHELIQKSCAEILPGCSTCAFQIYCGSDPIRNYSEQGDIIGHRPTSEFCAINKAILNYLFELLRNEDNNDVFWSWITNRSVMEIQGEELSRSC